MTDKAELVLLLDYYGGFLTERQRQLLEMSADEDMSLAEIAQEVGISRQAVRDSLQKASAQLHGFEEGLGLVSRDMQLRALADRLEAALSGGDPAEITRAAAAAAAGLRAAVK
ncbi:MAG: HTH domain-containing protein [Clostridia bacterium]|nr:HTH domain-containing protein [Clostridia bacterium]